MSKPTVSIDKFPASRQVKVSFREGRDKWLEIFSQSQYEAIREAMILDAEIDGLVTVKKTEKA